VRAEAYLVRRGRIWYARYVNELGKWMQESLCFRGSKLEARDKFSAWLDGHRRRAAERPRARITLAQLADEYLAHSKTTGKSAGWIAHQRQYLNGPMAAAFGTDTPLIKIGRRDIQAYLARLTVTVKRTTANKHRACLRTMFQFAAEQGYVVSSPAADVRRLKHDGCVHNRYLTRDEFRGLREVAEAQRAARSAILSAHAFEDLPEYLDLAISLATRPTETLTLKFSDVDWVNRQIAVRQTKNGKDRVLPLNDTALAALQALQKKRHAASDYVFHRADGRVWLDMRETFSQAVRAAGLWHADPMRRVTRHTLRHTTLSWMAQHGEPLQKIARFAGHSSTHVTEMFYAHLHPDHLKRAASVIDEELRTFLTNLVTTCPDRGTDGGTSAATQTPDKIDLAVLNASRAGVAILADARDSKSRSLYGECGFESLLRHYEINNLRRKADRL
jgi:integrase